MLIANTTSEKFLEAILAEQQKTNELLGQLLCSMRKNEEVNNAEPKAKSVKPKATKPKVTTKEKPKRGKKNDNN